MGNQPEKVEQAEQVVTSNLKIPKSLHADIVISNTNKNLRTKDNITMHDYILHLIRLGLQAEETASGAGVELVSKASKLI